jgi:hypothetical protein
LPANWIYGYFFHHRPRGITGWIFIAAIRIDTMVSPKTMAFRIPVRRLTIERKSILLRALAFVLAGDYVRSFNVDPYPKLS